MMDDPEKLSDFTDLILRGIEMLPAPLRIKLSKEIIMLKELVLESRPPRIMILGRRGAGKSSLINAIFNKHVASVGSVVSETGKPCWHYFDDPSGSLHIIDTRGLGDLTKPESANFENALDDIKEAVVETLPDVLLFLCKAKDVDSRVSEDITNIEDIRKFIKLKHDYDVPVIAVVTQVDELDPKREEPPYASTTKQDNIRKAVSTISKALDEKQIPLAKVIPVSAYAEYDNGVMKYNNFWNKETLVGYLAKVMPTCTHVTLARLSKVKNFQRKTAKAITNTTATICAGLAAIPIPVADLIPITGAQLTMVMGIAFISGQELSKKMALKLLAGIGANISVGFGLRELARGLIKFFLPGGGLAISATIAYAGTIAIGTAAIAYFIDDKSIEEAKRVFTEQQQKRKDEKVETIV